MTSPPSSTWLQGLQEALDWWAKIDGGDTSSIIGGGAIRRLELVAGQHFGHRQCLAVGSGTDALAVALISVGVKAGDGVICSSYDWAAACDAVRRLGAQPVFADPDPNTLTISPGAVASLVTSATTAIVATHLFGIPADIPALRQLGLPIVEDGSQAWGATLDNEQVGTLADAAVFSLGPGKTIDAGEGGLITFADQAQRQIAISASQHPVRQLLAGLDPRPAHYSTRISPAAAMLATYLLETERLDPSAMRADWADHRRRLTQDGWDVLPRVHRHRYGPVGSTLAGQAPLGSDQSNLPDLWLPSRPRPDWLASLQIAHPTTEPHSQARTFNDAQMF